MKIDLTTLKNFIDQSGYKINGASTEKALSDYLSKDFPNSEKYWKFFIVPATVRIDNLGAHSDHTAVRDGVSQELRDIGSYHYSIFLNLINAERNSPSFEQFYFYLGITCDLVEEFLQKVYLLILDCTDKDSQILKKLTKEGFLQLAEQWYTKNYETLFENYYSKGKANPIRIPNRKYILDEYFENTTDWLTYKNISEEIRNYRNIISHHHKLAFLQDDSGRLYIPKRNSLHKYKRWIEVEKVSGATSIPDDFIPIDVQITNNLIQIKSALQSLWEKPIADLYKLVYVDRNRKILHKYNLSI